MRVQTEFCPNTDEWRGRVVLGDEVVAESWGCASPVVVFWIMADILRHHAADQTPAERRDAYLNVADRLDHLASQDRETNGAP